MIKKVLIVDDDMEMLLSLKEGLKRYNDTFSVYIAGDGIAAIEKLEKYSVSLVVTDLKMPRKDGLSLLGHIMEHYPGIPVIIITGYSTNEMERLALEGGAVGYIAKPFMIEDLAKKILSTLRKESEGGTLHSVSSGMFLQLIEMEEKTCTIRIVDQTSKMRGILFFKNGELLDARVKGKKGEAAAYEIFSWDEVSLSIENECAQKQKTIHSELQSILLEAMRLKDEASQEKSDAFPKNEERGDKPDFLMNIRNKLENELGKRCGLDDLYHDDSWDGLISEISQIGEFFDAGTFKLGYLDRGESRDFILIPGEETTVILVSQNCPRDRVIEMLSS